MAPAVAFANHGYHVLVEKPMAVSEDDCRWVDSTITWDHVCLNFRCSGRSQRPVRMLESCWWFAMCSGINSLLSSYNMQVAL